MPALFAWLLAGISKFFGAAFVWIAERIAARLVMIGAIVAVYTAAFMAMITTLSDAMSSFANSSPAGSFFLIVGWVWSPAMDAIISTVLAAEVGVVTYKYIFRVISIKAHF